MSSPCPARLPALGCLSRPCLVSLLWVACLLHASLVYSFHCLTFECLWYQRLLRMLFRHDSRWHPPMYTSNTSSLDVDSPCLFHSTSNPVWSSPLMFSDVSSFAPRLVHSGHAPNVVRSNTVVVYSGACHLSPARFVFSRVAVLRCALLLAVAVVLP